MVSTLASGTRVRGFKPGRSHWIFRASEKSSVCLPSEGKWKNLSRVPSFAACKRTSVNYECASKIPCIVPSFTSRGLSCLCGAWRLWRWMRGTHRGQGYNRPTGCSAEKPHMRHLTLTGFCTKELFFIDLLGTLLKQSHYRSWQAQRVPGEWGSQISWQLAHEGGRVVSLTHCPLLPPGNIPGTHFC